MTPDSAPKSGAFAALDELIAAIILLVAKTVNFFVVLVIRLTKRVESGATVQRAEALAVVVPAPVAVPAATSTLTSAAPLISYAPVVEHATAMPPQPSHPTYETHAPRRLVTGPAIQGDAAMTPAVPARAEAAPISRPRTPPSARPSREPQARKAASGEERSYQGFISWHGLQEFHPAGRARYESYALHLRCGSNEEILQGKELEAAIASSGADIGDRIEVCFVGKEYVGTASGQKRFRNKWTVRRL